MGKEFRVFRAACLGLILAGSGLVMTCLVISLLPNTPDEVFQALDDLFVRSYLVAVISLTALVVLRHYGPNQNN